MRNFIIITSTLLIGVVFGITANRNREYLINAQFIRDHWYFRNVVHEKKYSCFQ